MCFRGPAKSLKMKECQLPPDRDALSQAHASPSYTQSLRAAICRQAVELRKQHPAKSLLSGVAIEPHESEKPKAPDVGQVQKPPRPPNILVNALLGAPRRPSLPCSVREKLVTPSEVTFDKAPQRVEPAAAAERTHGQSHQAAVRVRVGASSERWQNEGQRTLRSPLPGHVLSMTGFSRLGGLKSLHCRPPQTKLKLHYTST